MSGDCGYSLQGGRLPLTSWDANARAFSGMNIYQTALYGDLHSTGLGRSCERVVLRRGQHIAAMAQIRIKRLPLTHWGVAEVDWGPLWHHDSSVPDLASLARCLEALRQEFCESRGLELRIRPCSTYDVECDAALIRCFEAQGFSRNPAARPYHTVVIGLCESLDAIRTGFHQKWRNQLNVAERAGLSHEFGTTREHFDRFHAVYQAMWRQKKFPTGVRLPVIRKLHAALPESDRFLITLVRAGDTDIGATVCAARGDTLHYFLGATLPDEKDALRPGYLLQWLHVQRGKELGLQWYDLGGYDESNPNIARFKKRTNGRCIVFPGQFEALPRGGHHKVYSLAERLFQFARRKKGGGNSLLP